MVLPTHMEGHGTTFSLIGGLAKTLKRITIPRSSLDISEEIRKLSEQIRNERKLRARAQSQNRACSAESSNSGNADLVTPSCSTIQSNCSSVEQQPDFTSYIASLKPSIDTQKSDVPYTPANNCELIYQRESLLKLLSDDTDVTSGLTSISDEHTIGPCYTPPAPEPSHDTPLLLRIPGYIKAPARVFPVVIGSESYVLPYRDGGLTVVIVFNVVHAAGEFVVGKVTGCGPFDASIKYPDGIVITLEDEIKVIETKSISQMTIEEQLQYHQLKEEQNRAITESIQRYNHQQKNLSSDVAHKSEKTEPTKSEQSGDNGSENSDGESSQHQIIGWDVVGTVVKIPENDSPGLISCEIDDDFITVPFLDAEIQMVGGETVLFDMEVNTKSRRTIGKRIELAPLNANLKNEMKNNFNKKRKARGGKDKDLPLISCPPTVFSLDKITKKGMVGRIMNLPTKNKKGTIKFYLANRYSCASFLIMGPKKNWHVDALVLFDLNLWFDTSAPFEAANVTIAGEDAVIGRYSLQNFICDELPDTPKPWGPEDFRHLLLVLRQGGTTSYNWKSMSQSLKRAQGDIKNFLHIFVSKLRKATEPDGDTAYNKKQLDRFVDSINKITESQKQSRKRAQESNNENIPLSEMKRARNSSSAAKPVTSKGSSYVNQLTKYQKKTKFTSAQTVQMDFDPTGLLETSKPPHLSDHQHFVVKNLQSWCQVPQVPGDRDVNGVLGDILISCADHTTTPTTAAGSKFVARKARSAEETTEKPDLGAVYHYLGLLLSGTGKDVTFKLNEMESRIVLYLLQDLFTDISKRNLFTHKQFLLQRFFDFTANKTNGRTPINPFKLKGFLLHLPNQEPQRNPE